MTVIKKYRYRLIRLCIGFLIIGTGGSLFVYSNLGSDPLNLMSQGIAGILGLEVGTTNSLVQLSFLIAILLTARKRVGLGTIIGIFIIGGIMNIWSMLLAPLLAISALPIRIVCIVAAPVLIGFGVAMVQTANLGMVPNDLLPLIIFEKAEKFEYRYVRIAYDLLQFIIGLLLGGVFGIGTIVSALLTGPSIQGSLNLLGYSPTEDTDDFIC